MKKKRQTSVIKRMYVGFALMVLLLVATVVMMLDGNKRIHSQLESVTSNVFPLVTLANETSVKLLAADKIFKDVLTNQNVEYIEEYEEKFSKAHQEFSAVLELLTVFSRSNPALSQQLEALAVIEQRYFSESRRAMDNYQAQQIARAERQKASRRFQQLQMALWVGMKEHISSQGNLAIKLMAESYFAKLKQTETITSDALASDELEFIGKAIRDNKRSVTRLNYAYDSLVAQLPSLKEAFEQPVAQFTSDIGRKGGVLDQHFIYVEASNRLYQNIAVLSKEVDQAMAILATFRAEAEQLMSAAISNADDSYADSFTRASLAGGMVTLFAMALGWLLARNVRKPLFSVLNTLEALTDGDMTRRVSGNTFSEFDQLSNHINTLATNLQGILNQMSVASGNLAKVAMENQATTAESNSRLNIQRQQTVSVAAAMTEMEQSVIDVADRAQHSMEKVQDVEEAAQTGMAVIASTSSTIHQLSERLDESVAVVSTLQAVSSEIGSILDVIRNIADQTNLLALNAAVEAARAGEQGRGFTVVADEVRVLAKRTADSTAEIESMIQNLQQNAGLASSVMQACVSEMHKSITQSSDASHAMEDIQVIIRAISEMSSHIAQAAEEQTTTTHSIARSLEDISHIADANFRAMERVADGCVALDTLAKEQNTLVKKFIV
ncbi:methyl-accepting chemotaxis protein (plasmid) [Photobacterium sp. DA100]|uniref:methyl-accepting chemotaxis protein n=1 Tax=Photobacterium sp. DA100 TaxID=3027472 RepID=UPI00247A1D7C|nr:methyl-accepting chemotaxis protein [Photobacterium sp. DA100]WEM45347.1 methyl-accepting chemotaxis protein [Photobacterium sp. DA100]